VFAIQCLAVTVDAANGARPVAIPLLHRTKREEVAARRHRGDFFFGSILRNNLRHQIDALRWVPVRNGPELSLRPSHSARSPSIRPASLAVSTVTEYAGTSRSNSSTNAWRRRRRCSFSRRLDAVRQFHQAGEPQPTVVRIPRRPINNLSQVNNLRHYLSCYDYA
jgi:hypothetical protein